MLDEQEFARLAELAFRRIADGFEDIDADDIDLDTAGNTLTLTFRGGGRCVVNTQSATRQIWLAGGGSGWHFDFDPARQKWLHDKGSGDELFATLGRLCREATGLTPAFGA